MDKLLFSRKQAAALLGLSAKSVEHLNNSGALPFVKIGRRILIHRDVLTQFAQSGHAARVRP